MHAGELGGFDHLLGCRVLAEARDVLADRAVEELDALRQVADRIGKGLGRILCDQRLVEADFAARRRPGADEGAHQGRFAAAARPDDAEGVAGLDLEGHAAHRRLRPAGRHDRDVAHRQGCGWTRHAVLLRRALGKQGAETPAAA